MQRTAAKCLATTIISAKSSGFGDGTYLSVGRRSSLLLPLLALRQALLLKHGDKPTRRKTKKSDRSGPMCRSKLPQRPHLMTRVYPAFSLRSRTWGQTPAYRMFISSPVTVSGRGETPNIGYKGEDCAYITETAVGGLSLARTPFQERFGVGLSQAPRARAAVASGIYEVRAEILVCYRDVFNAVRHVRVCRRYFNGWDHTIPCDGEQDEHD